EIDSEVDLANTEAALARESASARIHQSESVAVLPLKGPFGWRCLLVAGAQGELEPEDMMVAYEFQGALSSRLAIALELDQNAAEIGAGAQQQARIVDFIRYLPALLPVESHLPEVLRSISQLLGSDSAAYWRVDPQTRTVNMVAADRLNAAEFLPAPIGRGFCGAIVESRQPLAIEDALADPRCLFPGQCREAGIASYLGVPVFTGSEVTGVLEVHTTRPHSWNHSNTAALRIAAASMESKNARGSTGPLGLRAETAYIALSEALHGLGSRRELLEAAVEVVGHAVGASRTLILQPETPEASGATVYVVRYEYCAENITPALGRSISRETLGRAVDAGQERTSLVIDDSERESLMPAAMVKELHVLSEVAVPIKAGDDLPWLLWVQRCDYLRPWTRDEVAFVERVARQIAIARTNIESLEKASAEAQAARAETRQAKESVRQTRDFVDALPEAVVGLDPEGRITFFNAYARDLFKLGNDDLGHEAAATQALNISNDSLWQRVNKSDSVSRFEGWIAAAREPLSAAVSVSMEPGSQPTTHEPPEKSTPVTLLVAPIRGAQGDVQARVVVIAEAAAIESDAGHTDQPQSNRESEQHQAKEAELEHRISELEGWLAEARGLLEKPSRGVESDKVITIEESERLRADHERATKAAQQLLEVNRLKSEFIVSAGHELDASLQSLLGYAELLGQGSYGELTAQQLEAVRGIYAWGRRLKSDVNWLIDYGSARSRRLEAPEE
ncbi:MAG TPA: GAF domain-containing protein, partial [Blastocatellia bacterium]